MGPHGKGAGSLQARPTLLNEGDVPRMNAQPNSFSGCDPVSAAWAGCAAARPGTPGEAKARHSQPDPDGSLPAKRRKAKEGLRPVGRVRAAQQRAWGYGDPATRELETVDGEARRPSEANASFKPSNDIEFSGEKEGAPATDAESAAMRC